MHVLNTTFVAHRSASDEFVYWVRDVYVPAMLISGLFTDVTVMRVLTEIDPDTLNYAVQARTERLADAERWQEDVASVLKNEIFVKTGEKVLSFTTSMEVIL